MSDDNKYEEPNNGCWFSDPRTLPGECRPAKVVYLRKAAEYARRIKSEEGREVTMEELQQFVEREAGSTEDTFDD